MRQTYILLTSLILFSITALTAYAQNVAYHKRIVRGTPVHVVTANLNSPNVKVSPAISRHGIGTSEGFGSMLSRLQPTASITGTYFCVRSLIPVGDIAIDGRFVNQGNVGTSVSFTTDNNVIFKPIGRRADLETDITSVLSSGPRLVVNGNTHVAPWAEGFTDRSLYRRARRSAIGITQHNKLLMVTVNRPVFLSELARIMRDLGAVNAINLDGGSSTAMSYKNIVPSHPQRRLTNLIVVYESPEMFRRVRQQLAPSLFASEESSTL